VLLYGASAVCLNGVCHDKQSSPDACGNNLSVCTDDGGMTQCCDGVCTSTITSENCGACGNNCFARFADDLNTDPACVYEVTTSTYVCVDRNTNRQHCGVNDDNCGSSDCVDGKCLTSAALLTSCGPEKIDCKAIGATSCCAGKCYYENDPYNCGGCNNTCFPGSSCIKIGSVYQCINLSTSNTNCGVPGRVCAVNEQCVNGSCTTFNPSNCGAQQTNCNNFSPALAQPGCCSVLLSPTQYNCVDLKNDVQNCGACGVQCAGGANALCVNGVCVVNSATNCGLNQQNCTSLAGSSSSIFQCCNLECVRVKLNPVSVITPYAEDAFAHCNDCNTTPPGLYTAGWKCCNGAYKNTKSMLPIADNVDVFVRIQHPIVSMVFV
jgi:hypothetical protein